MTYAETYYQEFFTKGTGQPVVIDAIPDAVNDGAITPSPTLLILLKHTDCIILAGMATKDEENLAYPLGIKFSPEMLSQEAKTFLDSREFGKDLRLSFLQYGRGNLLVVLSSLDRRLVYNLNRRNVAIDFQAQRRDGVFWTNATTFLPEQGLTDFSTIIEWSKKEADALISRSCTS